MKRLILIFFLFAFAQIAFGQVDIVSGTIKPTGYSNDISPSQITSSQNDYNPTGLSTASVLRLTTDASRNVTGLQGGADGRVIVVCNVGSFDLVLKNEDVASTAAYRFTLGADVTLSAGKNCILLYDATTSRWILISTTSSGSYTTEEAQDAVGAMIDASLTYVDGTPLLQRSALTGDATASAGSNATKVLQISEDLSLVGDLTPAQITGNTNNWTGSTGHGISTTLRIDASAVWRLESIDGHEDGTNPADGRILILQNIGSYDIILPDNSGAGDVLNDMLMPDSHDALLPPKSSVILRYDATSSRWRPISALPQWVKKVKETSTQITSDATLNDDPDLQFYMAANTTYHFRMLAIFNTGATGDFKFRHTGAASPTSVRIHRRYMAPAGTAYAGIAVDVAYSGADVAIASTGTTGGMVMFDGIITNGSTAGLFKFQWSQNTSDGTTTEVIKGSYIEYGIGDAGN